MENFNFKDIEKKYLLSMFHDLFLNYFFWIYKILQEFKEKSYLYSILKMCNYFEICIKLYNIKSPIKHNWKIIIK